MKTGYFLAALLVVTNTLHVNAHPPARTNEDTKTKALAILQTKCNFCHQSQNPGKVFTMDNMDRFASKIYKQVFVKHRMPKDNAVKLTTEEQNILLSWIKKQPSNIN